MDCAGSTKLFFSLCWFHIHYICFSVLTWNVASLTTVCNTEILHFCPADDYVFLRVMLAVIQSSHSHTFLSPFAVYLVLFKAKCSYSEVPTGSMCKALLAIFLTM